ncbi:DUF4179 domain-containing protein [Neobacillus sp. FSL H8-0543]|uniref:DUF4179 domain-containing protein n=1 Tax=Neobacillus sp. FSL H8-0543 TaxID=2954672 RepID=UPI003158AE31
MTNIEKRLEDEKKRIDAIETPLELEVRLRKALDTTRNPSRRPVIWKTLTVAMLLFLFVGYHFNAFAYYGKQILGFDDLITGTLKDLNNAGKGQRIEKSFMLDDETKLTINGVMTDANRMIVYYTVTDPNGLQDTFSDSFNPNKITGMFTSSNFEGSNGQISDDGTELKGMMDFEPPSPFAKKLTLHYWQYIGNNQMQQEKISFTYDPNKAMQTEIKQSINKTVKVDKGTIHFDSIVASPTLTVIKGSLKVENFDRLDLALHGIELLANGKSVEIKGSGSRSSLKGSKFEVRFDALPTNLDSLELIVKEFVGYKKLNQTIALDYITGEAIDIGGAELWMKTVTLTSKGIEIKIATEDTVLLDKVSIGEQSNITPLETTINQQDSKEEDGKIIKERTLVFDTTEMPEHLKIGGIHYMKKYDKKVQIPIK